MNKLLTATLQQLNGGKPVELKAVPNRQLPLLYRSLYNVTVGELLGEPCCLLEDRHAARITPGMSEKHTQTLCALTGKQAVYITEKMSAQDAYRLIAKKVAFVAANGYVYLPFAGIRLSGKPKETPPCTTLSIPAQLLVLAVLNKRLPMPLTYRTACDFLPYSGATVHAAFAQLQAADLCVQTRGRSVQLDFLVKGKQLWERALPKMQNPCRRTVEVSTLPQGDLVVPAGESALSLHTMLAAPQAVTYAMPLHDFLRQEKKRALFPIPDKMHPLQLWLYPPTLMGGEHIDTLSLYLSLRDTQDERVAQALEQLIQQFLW